MLNAEGVARGLLLGLLESGVAQEDGEEQPRDAQHTREEHHRLLLRHDPNGSRQGRRHSPPKPSAIEKVRSKGDCLV